MRAFIRGYILVSAVFTFLFMNFIACGANFYQVSLENDLEESKTPEEAKDPNSTLYGIHASQGWTQIPINFRFGEDVNDMQKNALKLAMQTWEKAVGKTLFRFAGIHKGVTGDSFPDLYSSLADQVNGHYLDTNWEKTQKPPIVLATTIWDNLSDDSSKISGADIRFNSEYYLIGDSLLLTSTEAKQVVDMQSLALHELGHLLGLAHVESSVDPLSIMNPQLFIGEGLTSRKLSRSDIERIQLIYGCEVDACDIDAVAKALESSNDNQSVTQQF